MVSGLTVKQSADIERVQRVAVHIILSDCATGRSNFTYGMGLVTLNLETLSERREKLCHTFAQKTLKSRHSDIFQKHENQHDTRNKVQFIEHKANTQRCYKSPVNYLTRLLNGSGC